MRYVLGWGARGRGGKGWKGARVLRGCNTEAAASSATRRALCMHSKHSNCMLRRTACTRQLRPTGRVGRGPLHGASNPSRAAIDAHLGVLLRDRKVLGRQRPRRLKVPLAQRLRRRFERDEKVLRVAAGRGDGGHGRLDELDRLVHLLRILEDNAALVVVVVVVVVGVRLCERRGAEQRREGQRDPELPAGGRGGRGGGRRG